MKQIVNMVLRQVIRRVVSRGVNAGTRGAANSPKMDAKRLRQGIRMLRRFTRF